MPVQPEQDEDSDDGIDDALMDLSETLLAIKALSQLFPRRAAPRNCPNLVLHSQLQVRHAPGHKNTLDTSKVSTNLAYAYTTHFLMGNSAVAL